MRISDWSSDVCSSDLERRAELLITEARLEGRQERIVDLEIAIDPPGVGIARVVILTARQRADIVIVDIGQIDTVDQRRGHLAARVDRQHRQYRGEIEFGIIKYVGRLLIRSDERRGGKE